VDPDIDRIEDPVQSGSSLTDHELLVMIEENTSVIKSWVRFFGILWLLALVLGVAVLSCAPRVSVWQNIR
jgi:hypothetical protein